MIQRGFTVVELILTITIMGILLTLAVVGLNASQANTRDNERRADAESVTTHLEAFYSNTDSSVAQSGNAYPGMSRLADSNIHLTLPNIDKKSTRAPGISLSQPISIVPATNTSENPSTVTPKPDELTYVYQALKRDGSLCDAPSEAEHAVGECRKFNFYYYQETTGNVEVIRSKHQ